MATIAVTNQKGGVGKTTITLCLGRALARTGERVLVLDLDPDASATGVLGAETEEHTTIADVLLEPATYELADAIQETEWGFDFVASEEPLASKDRNRRTADEFDLRKALEPVSDAYRVVLLDCPPSLGVVTTNALTAADRYVIIGEPNVLAYHGIGRLEETVELVREHFNPGLELGGVILNRVQEHLDEHSARIEEADDHFGKGSVWRPLIPFRAGAIGKAFAEGFPIDRLNRPDARELRDVFNAYAEKVVNNGRVS